MSYSLMSENNFGIIHNLIVYSDRTCRNGEHRAFLSVRSGLEACGCHSMDCHVSLIISCETCFSKTYLQPSSLFFISSGFFAFMLTMTGVGTSVEFYLISKGKMESIESKSNFLFILKHVTRQRETNRDIYPRMQFFL